MKLDPKASSRLRFTFRIPKRVSLPIRPVSRHRLPNFCSFLPQLRVGRETNKSLARRYSQESHSIVKLCKMRRNFIHSRLLNTHPRALPHCDRPRLHARADSVRYLRPPRLRWCVCVDLSPEGTIRWGGFLKVSSSPRAPTTVSRVLWLSARPPPTYHGFFAPRLARTRALHVLTRLRLCRLYISHMHVYRHTCAYLHGHGHGHGLDMALHTAVNVPLCLPGHGLWALTSVRRGMRPACCTVRAMHATGETSALAV